MGNMYIRAFITATIAATVFVITPPAQAKGSALPPRIVPEGSTTSRQHLKATAKKQHHRRAVRHHRKRR